LVLASAVTAVVRARPRNAVVRSIPPTDVTVAIRVGDVLKQSGNVIVGTNDTLDTQSEAEVISRASVQGQLLERVFSGDRDELDRQIDASIGDVTGVEDTHKQFGKSARYPIGTVAVVRFGGARYFLPAFARMSATLPAHGQATIEDLQVALASTWKAINAGGQREPGPCADRRVAPRASRCFTNAACTDAHPLVHRRYPIGWRLEPDGLGCAAGSGHRRHGGARRMAAWTLRRMSQSAGLVRRGARGSPERMPHRRVGARWIRRMARYAMPVLVVCMLHGFFARRYGEQTYLTKGDSGGPVMN
jgi:Thoeris protein ThsA, Macro domain